MYKEIITDEKLKVLESISIKAGDAIMDIYHQDFEVNFKGDNSPITQADFQSNEIINKGLESAFDFPILSEENDDIAYPERKNWEYLWVVDPLDGTKEFVNKRREFSVNIALVHKSVPVFGIIYIPVFKQFYYAIKGHGAFKKYKNKTIQIQSQHTVDWSDQKIVHENLEHIKIIMSRSHADKDQDFTEFIKGPSIPHLQTISMGSAVKFCRVAEGKVDAYIRNKPTMEWDTASGQIIVEEAGRKLLRYDSNKLSLTYNRENLVNDSFVVV